MSQWETGCYLGVTGQSGGSDNRGLHRKNYIRLLVSWEKESSYLSSISTLTSFGLLQNPSLDKSIIVILEYTSSNHVKLLDHLSDPQEPLIYWIYSEIPSGTLSGLANSCFICICVHGFPVSIPSFCKKGKPLKTKHWLLKHLLRRWNLCQTYTNSPSCTPIPKRVKTLDHTVALAKHEIL